MKLRNFSPIVISLLVGAAIGFCLGPQSSPAPSSEPEQKAEPEQAKQPNRGDDGERAANRALRARIKELEDIVSVNNLNGETPDRKKQLRDDIVLIQQSINKHKQRLEELEKRLKQSTNYNSSMQKSIANLKSQLDEQQKTINNLTEQLAAAHVQIKNLNQSVDSLNTVNKNVTKEKEAAQQESKQLTNEVTNLNTCYYVIGSKKELKANKIIETGFLRKTKILEGDFEMSYFTKADRRTLNEIPLHSAKAEVMTNHPKDSYEIVDYGNIKTLRILNPNRFWEKTNFLVVKVN